MDELLFNKSDYEILLQLIKENKTSPINSLTKKQLSESTTFSISKIRIAMKNFLFTGMVKEGTKDGNSKTYYITDGGIKHYQKIYNISDEEIEKIIVS